MATATAISQLRRKISEPDNVAPYTDTVLSDLIDAEGGDTDAAAVVVWEEKASQFSELVDISEAGSSRKNSQLASAAREQARYYAAKSDSDLVAGVDYPTTTRIVRA